MRTMGQMDDLRIQQLDEALAPFADLRDRALPATGWAKAIREALGISLRQPCPHFTVVGDSTSGLVRPTLSLRPCRVERPRSTQ